jgi:3-oxoacyl-[acyl-carrier protein] reductase
MNAPTHPRTAIVTGSSSGIGLAIAKRLASEGYRVAIVGRDSERARHAADQVAAGSIWQSGDLRLRADVERVVAAIVKEFGRVDVLVNNAGSTQPVSADMPLQQAELAFEQVLDANLKSTFLISLATLPHLSAPGARVINISSIAAQAGSSRPGGLAYAAAKAGIQGFTLSLARELAPRGITVNAVAPGFIASTRFFGDGIPNQRLREIVSETPLNRAGAPDDVANAVTWLAAANTSFVTGSVVSVNGGWRVG